VDRLALDVRRGGVGGNRRGCESGQSSREAGPALVAAGLENGPTASRAHARPEAVRLGSAACVGLVCALHVILRDCDGSGAMSGQKSSDAARDNECSSYRPDRWPVVDWICQDTVARVVVPTLIGTDTLLKWPELVPIERHFLGSSVDNSRRIDARILEDYIDVSYPHRFRRSVIPAHGLFSAKFRTPPSRASVRPPHPQEPVSTLCGQSCGSPSLTLENRRCR
jgi:hypothetical protein